MKWLVGLLALIYLVVPTDAIPDIVPVLGWLDDAGILGLGLSYFVASVRRQKKRIAEPQGNSTPKP